MEKIFKLLRGELHLHDLVDVIPVGGVPVLVCKPPKKQPRIVFAHNHDNRIMVTRDSEGIWRYRYSITDEIKRNQKADEEGGIAKSYLRNTVNMFDVGMKFGYVVTKVLDECRKSYGDILTSPE